MGPGSSLLASVVLTQPCALLLAILALLVLGLFFRRTSRSTARTPRGPLAGLPGRATLGAAAIGVLALTSLALPSGARAAALSAAALAAAWTLARATYSGGGAAPLASRRLAGLRFLAAAIVLLLVARPTCDRQQSEWQRPVLAVLLDQSRSMLLRDERAAPAPSAVRAERVAGAIAAASRELERLADRYDVRLLHLGQRAEPADTWTMTPRAPYTAISAGLQAALSAATASAGPPGKVLLISDGAETLADERAVEQAATALDAAGVGLLALGVGPAPGRSPAVALEPLSAPPRVAPRDRVKLVVTGRVQGCADHALSLRVAWGDRLAEQRAIPITAPEQRFSEALDLLPPGPGVHRLTAVVTLPDDLGGAAFAESTLIEVRDDRIRVLLVDRGPQTESAFIARALLGDEAFDVSRRLLAADADDAAPGWDGYDVIILGRIGGALQPDALAELPRAVGGQAAGLLLAGGRELLAHADYGDSPLAELCPAVLPRGAAERPTSSRVRPADGAASHPVLAGFGSAAEGVAEVHAAGWGSLAPLNISPLLAVAKPGAAALLIAADGRPALLAQEYERGRVAAAAWEATWPWALASDAGHSAHRQLWRQLVQWLANRRPRAWVTTDQDAYALDALETGQQQVLIRAGLAGLPASGEGRRVPVLRARLTMRRAGSDDPESQVPLRRDGDRWRADWPAGPGRPALVAGEHELRIRIVLGGPDEPNAPTFDAATRFTLAALDLETRPPTANLALLQAAARHTERHGGRYAEVESLSDVLDELLSQDPRRRVVQVVRRDVVAAATWLWLLVLLGVLGLEWTLRRRDGLP